VTDSLNTMTIDQMIKHNRRRVRKATKKIYRSWTIFYLIT